jgi:hypothetical protein
MSEFAKSCRCECDMILMFYVHLTCVNAFVEFFGKEIRSMMTDIQSETTLEEAMLTPAFTTCRLRLMKNGSEQHPSLCHKPILVEQRSLEDIGPINVADSGTLSLHFEHVGDYHWTSIQSIMEC